MEIELNRFTPAEQATFRLRALYEQAGYRKYRASRFEEYALYQEYQRFLPDAQVITFTDLDGKLRAIKPDVTLSIAKTAQPAAGECKRFYYNEEVCRPSRESHTFQTIHQMGLESMGAVDADEQAAVVRLALQSLAALDAVLSQFASAAFVLRFLRGNRVLLRLEFECPQVKTVCKIALMGLSPFLIIAFDNVLIISLNTVIQMYGGAEADMLLTCTTIVQSFMLIVTMPLGGITSGTGAILGFNFGAGRPDRIRSAQKYITLLAVVQCSIMFLFSRTLAQYFVYLFTRNESYVELTVWAIRVYTMGIIPLAVQYEVVDGFTGMGVPSVAISLSMFRKLLYLVSVFLIPVFAGVENVFYAEVVSDFGGTTVSVIVYLLLIGRIMGRCVERAKLNGNSDNAVINQ